jgi:hypothetical protein
MNQVLVPHPLDKFGPPPLVGQTYVVEPTAKATASFQGFTDTKGAFLTWEEGCAAAADVVMRQYETEFVEELMAANCSPDDVLEWLVDPDTGEFAP